MKKTASIAMTFLSIALLAGANIVQHFAARKLGMVRWLNYNGRKLEDTLPLDLLFHLGLALVVALALLALWRLWTNRDRIGAPAKAGAVLMVALTIIFGVSVIAVTRDVTPAYFLIRLLLGLAALLQIASTLIWSSPENASH